MGEPHWGTGPREEAQSAQVSQGRWESHTGEQGQGRRLRVHRGARGEGRATLGNRAKGGGSECTGEPGERVEPRRWGGEGEGRKGKGEGRGNVWHWVKGVCTGGSGRRGKGKGSKVHRWARRKVEREHQFRVEGEGNTY